MTTNMVPESSPASSDALQGLAARVAKAGAASLRIAWADGVMIPRKDGLIVQAAEENGRRFWALPVRTGAGWPFTHEFCTAEEALDFELEDRR